MMHSMMDLDPLPSFYLMGEMGLAGLFALGVKVGKVDRAGDNLSDYAQVKDFFSKLIDKAIQKDIKIYFPRDVLVSQKYEIEDTVKESEINLG